MGNDGGSYQNCRADIVKEKPKEIKIDQNIIARNKQKLCTLTQQPLRKPIAVCRLGNLYNYEDILKALSEKSLSKRKFAHIKSLKDIKKLNLPNQKEDSNKDRKEVTNSLIFCQITHQEFNGLARFVVIFSCGCVMSEKAFNAAAADNKNKNQHQNQQKNKLISSDNCLVCNQPFKKNDVVSLNMTPEEQQELQEQLIQSYKEKKQQKQEEKQKKKQKKLEKDVDSKQLESSKQLQIKCEDDNELEEQKINHQQLKEKKKVIDKEFSSQQQLKVKKVKAETKQSDSITSNSNSNKITSNVEMPKSLMDKIAGGEKLETQPQQSEIYKSLFHKEYKVEDANTLMFRNVRHGIR